MILKLFVIKDSISNSFELGGISPNHQMFIRENVSFLVKLRPLADLQLFEAGTFDTESGSFDLFHPDNYILCEWSDYHFPETRSEALAPLNLETSSEKRIQYEDKLKEIIKSHGE